MFNKILIVIVVILLGVMITKLLKNKKSNTMNEVEEWIEQGATLVDVRNPDEFESGSVPTAVNYPLPEIEDHLEDLRDKERIIVFCRSGNRSGQAMEILKENGIDQVINGGTWNDVNEAYEKVKDNQ